MNVAMLRRALKDLRWTVVWYAGGLAAFVLVMMGFFPTVRENAEEFQRMLSAYPEPFMKAFGVTDFTTLSGFIGAEVLSALWPLIAAIFVILAGAATVAQEIERGTVELWLSVPERRWRLLLAKVAALLIGIVLITATTLAALALGAAAIGERFARSGLLAAGVVLASFSIAVGGYAVLCSSFSGDRGKAAGIAAALTLAFYMAYLVAELSERWAWLGRVTIFTAYQPQRALETGQVPLAGTVALLAIGVACVAGAAAIFERRSIVA
jgi:ABC-2 type transport system permease protein